jgi:molybdopterin-synthase adenylyltransferase
MPSIRLSRSASITPTGVGVIVRSDLGTFQITGSDVSTFLEQMVPLLDGSRDREALSQALSGYSRQSVMAFLDLLAAHGLLEAVRDDAARSDVGRESSSAVPFDRERWRGQEEFLHKWSKVPEEAQRRLAAARVLVVGLDPWGATAAVELAAAGIRELHLIDGGAVGSRDILVIRERGEAALGASRRDAAAAVIRDRSPWCHVNESPVEALDAADFLSAHGPFSVLVAAVPPDDADQIERVARFAHRAGIASLWSHLAGTTAVLGPLVTPGKTACRICATAEAVNPSLAERLAKAPAPYTDTMGQLLGHLVAMEALKAISAYTDPRVGGRLVTQDLSTLEVTLHTLVRLPWCRVCGELLKLMCTEKGEAISKAPSSP